MVIWDDRISVFKELRADKTFLTEKVILKDQ
jgi:hypothetical protein